MTCAVISVKLCSSEVPAQNPPATESLFIPEEELILYLFFTANTTRIFEGSRIVKTGMVSRREDASENVFWYVNKIHGSVG